MSVRFRYGGSRGASGGMPETASAPDTALDDLEQQLRLSGLGDDVCRVAIDMLHLLTPRGYFTQDISEFALEAGIPARLSREALQAIQALEPAGVGARTVAECLELQLQARAEASLIRSPTPICFSRLYAPPTTRSATILEALGPMLSSLRSRTAHLAQPTKQQAPVVSRAGS